MTTRIVSATETATTPYSAERLAAMARADRITQVRFAARRKGESLTVGQAIAIVDAEIEATNAKLIAADLSTVETVTVENGSVAANDSGDNSPEPTPVALPTTRDELLALVSDGKVFAAEFIKRDKSVRTMQCRLGVSKHLKGGVKAYEDAAKGILTVFDMQAAGYRSIRIAALTALTVKGQRYAAV